MIPRESRKTLERVARAAAAFLRVEEECQLGGGTSLLGGWPQIPADLRGKAKERLASLEEAVESLDDDGEEE